MVSADELLKAALEYHSRGFSILPISGKHPAIKTWKPFQRRRADRKLLEKWLLRAEGIETDPSGLAVIAGEVSGGLCLRDFDKIEAYDRWAGDHADLAGTLPTAKTGRGFHVYFRFSGLREIRKIGDCGELRGAGYSLLPPSLHPDGLRYSWVIGLPDGPLPEIDPFREGLGTDTTDTTYTKTQRTQPTQHTQPTHSIAVSVHVSEAVERAIARTLPLHSGERNRQLFSLCRALKDIPDLVSHKSGDLRPIVQEWHRRALPVILTKDFDSTWADFLHGWPRAKPSGELLRAIVERAKAAPLPVCAQTYEDVRTQLLVKLCRELQLANGGETFFLSVGSAADLTGLDRDTAHKRLRMLVADGVLELVEIGQLAGRRASVYRYVGEKIR